MGQDSGDDVSLHIMSGKSFFGMLSFMLQDLSIRNDVPITRLILLGNHTKVADGYSKSGYRRNGHGPE